MDDLAQAVAASPIVLVVIIGNAILYFGPAVALYWLFIGNRRCEQASMREHLLGSASYTREGVILDRRTGLVWTTGGVRVRGKKSVLLPLLAAATSYAVLSYLGAPMSWR